MKHALFRTAAVTLAGLITTAQAQDGTLRAWLEAPETISAGDTATVTAWVSFESDVFNMDEAFFGTMLTSITVEAGGNLVRSFSTAYGDYVAQNGSSNANGVFDIWAWQPGLWAFNKSINTNLVIAAFSFDVETQAEITGMVQLGFDHWTNDPDGSPYLAWNLDFDQADIFVDSTMSNIETSFEPLTIHVIPAPGVAALLMFTGLCAPRRQR